MKYTILSDVGKYRQRNEDAVTVLENQDFTLALLCDGMGGHSQGALASNLAIKAFTWIFQHQQKPDDNVDAVVEWFSKGIKKALNLMKLEAKNDLEKLDMGTTLVAFLKYHHSNNAYFFNIGDSRAYVFNGILTQITTDQNHLNYLIKHENFSELEAKNFPGVHALLSSLGPHKVCKPEAHYLTQAFQYVILSSDGIHDSIPKPLMEKILLEDLSLETKAQKILTTALELDSRDNLSIIILEVA